MKRFRRVTDMCVGGLVALALAFGSQAVWAAANQWTKVQATLTYRNIKVNINGQDVTLTDLEGNKQEPFAVFDTIYVPLSATARALGKSSVWDNENSTVNIRNVSASAGVPVKLSALSFASESGAKLRALGDVKAYGDIYVFDAIGYDGSSTGSRDYAINGRYTRIEGDLFTTANSSYWGTTKVQFWGDQRLLYEGTIEGGKAPVHFSVNLVGVNSLKIDINGVYSSKSGIGNVTLYRHQ